MNRSNSQSTRNPLQNSRINNSRLSSSNQVLLTASSIHSQSCESFVQQFSNASKSNGLSKYRGLLQMRRSISADAVALQKNKKGPTLDRFIPCRAAMDIDVCSFLMTNKENDLCALGADGVLDEQTIAKRKLLKVDQSILQFRRPERKLDYNLNVRFGEACLSDAVLLQQAKGKHHRHIPKFPERVLDAPSIRDDFYIQVIDWSTNNIVGLALDNKTYLWNAVTHDATCLYSCSTSGSHISAISFLPKNDIIAISTSNGSIEIRDYKSNSHIRAIGNQQCRIAALCWNISILASGSRSGRLQLDDVRCPISTIVKIETAHRQEVCGMSWSPCHKYLATGGNDNRVHVWDIRKTHRTSNDIANRQSPLHSLPRGSHNAAVKALAWCPWQHSLLATGGGTSCRSILVTNVNNKETVAQIKDTQSQITGLIWSERHRELISSHGVTKCQLTMWRWPKLVRICELADHTGRIIGIALSPDGQTVVSASADETLRFWECYSGGYYNAGNNRSISNILNGISNGLVANNNFPFGNVR